MRTRHFTVLLLSLVITILFWGGSELFKMQRLSVIQEDVDKKQMI